MRCAILYLMIGVELYLFEASDRTLDELRTRPSHSAKLSMSPAKLYQYIYVRIHSKNDRSSHATRF